MRALASFSFFSRSTSPTRSYKGNLLVLALRLSPGRGPALEGLPGLLWVTGWKVHSAKAASSLALSSSSLSVEAEALNPNKGKIYQYIKICWLVTRAYMQPAKRPIVFDKLPGLVFQINTNDMW